MPLLVDVLPPRLAAAARSSSSTRRSSSSTRRAACRSRSRSTCRACARTWPPSRGRSRSETPRPVRAPVAAHPRRRRRSSATSTGDSPFLYVSVVDVATACRARGSGVQLQEPDHRAAPRRRASPRGLAGQRPMISHPIISTSLQEPVIVLAEPVRPGKAPAAGRGARGGQPRPVSEHDASRSAQEGLFEVYVVDARGRLVAHSDRTRPAGRPRRLRRSRSSGSSSSRRACGGATVPFTDPGTEGHRREDARAPTPAVPDDSGWGVIVQVEEDKAYYARHPDAQPVAGPRGAW